MEIIIRKIDWMPKNIEHGWGNGYVCVPKGHKLHGMELNEIDKIVDVHGGVTFAELITKELADDWKISMSKIGTWCIGFDTNHFRDNEINWTMNDVVDETIRLHDQILNY